MTPHKIPNHKFQIYRFSFSIGMVFWTYLLMCSILKKSTEIQKHLLRR